jgi:hypothetical protein
MAKKTAQKAEAKLPSSKPEKQTKISSDDFPRRTIEAAIKIGLVIRDTYGSNSASWPEIATALGVSEKNPTNRYPVWAAVAYGILKKTDDNNYSLGEIGRKIIAPNYEGEKEEGIRKALFTPTVLSKFYTDYNGSTLPSSELLPNVLENRYSIPRDRCSESIEIIRENAKFANALQVVEGKERLLFNENGSTEKSVPSFESDSERGEAPEDSLPAVGDVKFDKVCFVITPIGSEDSEERKHANAMLRHLIEPVLKNAGLQVVRADTISKPGIITQQIIEYIARAKICVADLSFNNPNAFYELGVRHAFKLSTVQIIRKGDKIPFDVSQGRTIIVDTSDPYTILDKIESGRSELKEHVEAILKGSDKAEDNPINLYLPGLKVIIPQSKN